MATLATFPCKRGRRIQVIQDVWTVAKKSRNMVGAAVTLRCIPAREGRVSLEEIEKIGI